MNIANEEDIKITYFFRKKNYEHSIERVFRNVQSSINVNYSNNYVPYNEIRLIKLIKNFLFCRQLRGKINHITGDIYYCMLAMSANNTVITFHDLGILKSNSGLKKYFFYFFWYYFPIKKAKHITCISEFTKKEITEIVKCDPKKISVIHNPISPSYIYRSKNFNSINPRILHIGTRNNKNLERVIEALEGIECHLRIIGKLSIEQNQMLADKNVIYSNAIDLSDDEIINEYIQCDIVSFPSLYEGFGMPIVEAQAVGRVVVGAEIEPLIEVSNRAMCCVNPYDVQSIRDGFISVIASEKLREELIINGLENVKNYTSDAIAAQYMQLYNLIDTK